MSNYLPNFIERDDELRQWDTTPVSDAYESGYSYGLEGTPLRQLATPNLAAHHLKRFADEILSDANWCIRRVHLSHEHGREYTKARPAQEFNMTVTGVPRALAWGVGRRVRVAVEMMDVFIQHEAFRQECYDRINQFLTFAEATRQVHTSYGRRKTRSEEMSPIMIPVVNAAKELVCAIVKEARRYPAMRRELADFERYLSRYMRPDDMLLNG
jgi:hypothetical protein